jgi:tRNA(Arg) A34 adenosine deaminase TadA
MTDEHYMRMAIAKTKAGIAAGQSPFGSVIVHGDRVVAEAHNTVWRDTDPTAHAEVNAIRQAARALGTIDFTGVTLYTTCEPCPMCLAASHWARVTRIVYGATIADAQKAGFNELTVSARTMITEGGSHMRIDSDCCREECAGLFELFLTSGKAKTY